MSQIRLYLDEDVLERSLVVALRSAGVDVMTTSDANKLSCTDDEQLMWAMSQGRVLYSFNARDFCRLHKTYMEQRMEHPGIVLGKQSYSVGEQLRGLLRLIATKTAESMRNQQEFLGDYIRAD